jgi:hypothetical protein
MTAILTGWQIPFSHIAENNKLISIALFIEIQYFIMPVFGELIVNVASRSVDVR